MDFNVINVKKFSKSILKQNIAPNGTALEAKNQTIENIDYSLQWTCTIP